MVPADIERQSTHLLGGHEDEDVDYIEAFEFEDDPIEVIGDAPEWAESVVADRRQSYRDRVPGTGD